MQRCLGDARKNSSADGKILIEQLGGGEGKGDRNLLCEGVGAGGARVLLWFFGMN